MIFWKKNADGQVSIWDNEQQTFKAKMAYAFADHMIMATMQGHGISKAMFDNTAQPHERHSNIPMSVEEIATTACNLSEVLYAEMRRREFVVSFPMPEDWTECS